jgi:hypothetical protein
MSHKRKTRVLSVRVSLEALQSVFDLCQLSGFNPSGASSALSQFLEATTGQFRSSGKLPSYDHTELEVLLEGYVSKLNPTSGSNLSKISKFNDEIFNTKLERPTTRRSSAAKLVSANEEFSPLTFIPNDKDDLTSGGRVVPIYTVESGQLVEPTSYDHTEDDYEELLTAKIREIQKEEEDDLLSKIIMGG